MDSEAGAAGSDGGGGGGPVRFPTAAAEGPTVASSSEAQKERAETGERLRFRVELKSGETTIVSWKRLLKEVGKGGQSPSVQQPLPVFQDQVPSIEGEGIDAPTSNRFNAVIEKIERLYMGKQSSDEEELDGIPDDNAYDTEDSFIDDADLDEYFQVDKATTKHNGYFVNKGKLEQIEPNLSPDVAPKKRRRKDSIMRHNEKDGELISKDPVNMSDMRIKATARSIPLEGKKSSSTRKVLTPFGEHYQDERHLKNKLKTSTSACKKKSADLTTNSENPSHIKAAHFDASSLLPGKKNFNKQKLIPSKDITYKSKGTRESFDGMYSAPRTKVASSQVESQSKKFLDCENDIDASARVRHKERDGLGEFSLLNPPVSTYPMPVVHPSSTQIKEGFTVRSKGTTLERAIRDLEKIVALCRPPDLDAQEMDVSSQGVKRRLPQEVKQKLAKVARLSASQGKISEDDLIDRLMGILGHLIQRKTLKRNMKEMVELGLSARQQNADKFQEIKKEVNEMIQARVTALKPKVTEQQGGSTNDFQEAYINDGKRAQKGRHSMDRALEDKISDLYDLYVEGMDEDKGRQSRKLYVEIADLWPSGYMDNLGIKEAIYRSKERKRAMYNRQKARFEERIKRKNLASAMRVDESNLNPQVRSGQERPAIDSSTPVNVLLDKQITSQSMSDSSNHCGSKHYEKMRGDSSLATEDGINNAKKKRRPDSERVDVYAHPVMLPQQDSNEKHRRHKHSDDDASMSKLPKSKFPSPVPPSSNDKQS
ncbi:ubinuclein protein [Dioscorea alata]|uniref:Ubinuclein protein n=1 Tax=Dioscorea alata TaxID=55571 RepID=A0ACB7USH3_DIOAL|nr:ubinuclein protein [Dioscorea alata]